MSERRSGSEQSADGVVESAVDVSVVIAAYRGAETIADCLESVLRATEGRRREVIVVESSGDGARAIIRERFPEVVLVTPATRRSAGGARNDAFKLARGRLVFVTDQDCRVPSDWITRLEEHFSDPQVGAAGGAVGVRDPWNLSGFAVYCLEFWRHFPSSAPRQRNRTFLVGCNSAYRAETLRHVAFPDQTIGEDVLFSAAIRARDQDVIYDPSIVVDHRNRHGWGEFFRYNRKMGHAAARLHRELGQWWKRPFFWFPPLVLLAPAVIVPWVFLNLLRSRWSYLGRFVLLLPLCIAGNLTWATAFCAQALADGRHRPSSRPQA